MKIRLKAILFMLIALALAAQGVNELPRHGPFREPPLHEVADTGHLAEEACRYGGAPL